MISDDRLLDPACKLSDVDPARLATRDEDVAVLILALHSFAADAEVADVPTWKLQPSEVVAILGGTNAVNMQNAGYFETLVTQANPNAKARFLDIAWEGDTVYRQGTVIERWRKDKFGDLAKQLTDNHVTCVVLLFGQSESLDGPHKLSDFEESFQQLVSASKQFSRRVIVVSPIPFEKSNELLPNLAARNGDLTSYVEAMRRLAKANDCEFVDVFSKLQLAKVKFPGNKLTENGLHIAPHAQRFFAEAVTRLTYRDDWESLRSHVIRKHRLWMNYWRPANWKCLYGDDGQREFGKATTGGLTLRQEWAQLPDLIRSAETEIWSEVAK